MLEDIEKIERFAAEYGSPLYVFNEKGFEENYLHLSATFRKMYENYNIAYSFKTNYTPYIASTVKRLGGFAEVVSGMEYFLAKKIGFSNQEIIFNGPNKGADGEKAFLSGCLINADSLDEVRRFCELASVNPAHNFQIGLRVNIDVGQNFISRFGIDVGDLSEAFRLVKTIENLKVVGLHCHISRCRGIDAWKRRIDVMLELADRFFDIPPKYIDLGSGMFGSMEPEFAAQFDNIPSYEEYAEVVAGLMDEHYKHSEKKPMLFTEPGTTLVNRFVDFIGRVDAIKTVRGKNIAILNCSEHNLGETCTLKELPMRVVPVGEQKYFNDMDITGYTCLEQDVMRKNFTGNMAVGDYIVFGNVGGYSNVLKPPFIWPNCKMIADCRDGTTALIKNAETYDDIFHTYIF